MCRRFSVGASRSGRAAGRRPSTTSTSWSSRRTPSARDMTDDVFTRGDTREVLAIPVNLMALEDVFATKLMSFDEHSCAYQSVLLMARSLREQIDWEQLHERVGDYPFARAFFVLVEELGIAPGPGEE